LSMNPGIPGLALVAKSNSWRFWLKCAKGYSDDRGAGSTMATSMGAKVYVLQRLRAGILRDMVNLAVFGVRTTKPTSLRTKGSAA